MYAFWITERGRSLGSVRSSNMVCFVLLSLSWDCGHEFILIFFGWFVLFKNLCGSFNQWFILIMSIYIVLGLMNSFFRSYKSIFDWKHTSVLKSVLNLIFSLGAKDIIS